MIESADNPVYEKDEELEKNFPKDPISKVVLPRARGIDGIRTEYSEILTRIRGTRLKAAVELYQRWYNELPKDLNVLISVGIIDQIPIDPFSNESFKYTDGKIYSIGRNFKDDKAFIKYDQSKDDDFCCGNESNDIIFLKYRHFILNDI